MQDKRPPPRDLEPRLSPEDKYDMPRTDRHVGKFERAMPHSCLAQDARGGEEHELLEAHFQVYLLDRTLGKSHLPSPLGATLMIFLRRTRCEQK